MRWTHGGAQKHPCNGTARRPVETFAHEAPQIPPSGSRPGHEDQTQFPTAQPIVALVGQDQERCHDTCQHDRDQNDGLGSNASFGHLLRVLRAWRDGDRIKECQSDLFACRTSAATMRANQLRLWFAAFAYVPMAALRRIGRDGTGMEIQPAPRPIAVVSRPTHARTHAPTR